MNGVVRRPSANHDLLAIFRHYALKAGFQVADRFFAEVEATFSLLALMPSLGTSYEPEESLYADLRYFPVSRFRAYLIFYRVVPEGIEVYRVLHGARDITGILIRDFGIEEDSDQG